MRLKNLLREPLLHFLLIGALLFVVYNRVAEPDKADKRIVVTQAMVDQMAREFQGRWTRPATAEEMTGLIQSYVHDEVLYREGLALGLDRDDQVIKRRVMQKFEVMSEEATSGDAPSDDQLLAFMKENPSHFLLPATLSFEQIFFSGASTAAEVSSAVAGARAALARGVDPSKLGQRTLLPGKSDNVGLDQVARDFGPAFATQLNAAPLGEWTGPLSSSFGVHLVRISARTPEALPPLDAIRPAVAREWENQRRVRSRDDNYRKLLSGYAVIIEAKSSPAVAAR